MIADRGSRIRRDAHQDAILAASRLPFVSIVEETVDATLARLPDARAVGVLASSGALDAGLYKDAFERRGVRALGPAGEARERFMALLYRVKAGDKGDEVRAQMRDLAVRLVEEGAEAIVAGCTEVPLVLFAADLEVPLIDSTEALVEATVAYATGARPLPARR